ncbi:Peroxidase 44 [Bienertia sinuspersici]
MRGTSLSSILILGLIILTQVSHCLGQLKVGFYEGKCGKTNVENVIYEVVKQKITKDPDIVSDLVRVSFHDCFVRAGGKWYEVETGRRDGLVSLKSEAQANIPPPTMPVAQAIELFARKGLNKDDFVVLLAFLDQTPKSHFKIDNAYYKQILARKGVLEIDQNLALSHQTRGLVKGLATSPHLFLDQFGPAMVKMARIGVLTGTQGEIRKTCGSVN